MKYEKMVERNRRRNAAKEDLAIHVIREMKEAGEFITVKKLTEKTGLSKNLFYGNQKVRDALNAAKREQAGACYAREKESVINQALLMEVQMLRKEIRILRKKCER